MIIMLILAVIQIKASPMLQIAHIGGNSVTLEIVVPKHPDNRLLIIEHYQGSSRIQLDGNSPVIVHREIKNLTAGEYEAVATLVRVTNGKEVRYISKTKFLIAGEP